MGLFKHKKKYDLVNSDDPAVKQCFKRGFMPIADGAYIDEVLTEVSGLNQLIIIPEIEMKSINLIDDIVGRFDQYYEENGDLPGNMLQNMASWMFAWGLEMAWCWNNDCLEQVVFEQDMTSFKVPMKKFETMPQSWFASLLEAFMAWCYSNPGYTEKYSIDVYDPIRDGYLTMIRCAVTKSLPSF